jgi:ABC-type uncharacterized transport system
MNAGLDSLWFVGTLAAFAVLLAAALRLPVPPNGSGRVLLRAALVIGVLGAAVLANVALFKHDAHFDLTREKSFTPAPESQQIVRALDQDVELIYFYQKQSPAGRAAKTMVEVMGKLNPRLHVQTIDPDQNPALASSFGVRMYNAALLVSNGQRIEVISTDDREIALGIVRLLRQDRRPVCFVTGHGEYDIDNFEFHTHFEGQNSHSHDAGGLAVVQMEQHGAGRLRRALEKLGYGVRAVSLATLGAVPEDCAVLIQANPRTRPGPPEVEAIAGYLMRGGNLLMMIEPDYPVDGPLASLLARAGVGVEDGVIVDPISHYYTDEQMIAVTAYAKHPATIGLALSFFPGARPLKPLPAPGVRTMPLFSSSAASRVISHRLDQRLGAAPSTQGARALAIVSEGRLDGRTDAKPFRLIVIGDADFASNSFYPYLANADLVLGVVAWLRGEERGPAMKPPVEVLPTVVLTNSQTQGIFIVTVLVLPGLLALLGAIVWWRRRY